jgi:hypothetical protein
MKTVQTLTIGLAVLAMLAGIASAHPKAYINPNLGVGISIVDVHTCPGEGEPTPEEDLLTLIGFEIGGVSLCPGDVVPDGAGLNTVTISDDLISPASGTYCQDINANSICGEAPIPPDGDIRLEPRVRFCSSVVLQSPLDSTPRVDWSSNNWDPDTTVLIFIDSLGTGNPVVSPCGTLSLGIIGSVNHT